MAWELDAWEPVTTLEPAEDEASYIDVDFYPVETNDAALLASEDVGEDASLQAFDNEVIDIDVQWLAPEPDKAPVRTGWFESVPTSTEIERHTQAYIATEDDMATAREWLDRVSEPKTQTQLAPATETQPQTLTAFWQHISSPVKTAAQRHTYSGPAGRSAVSSGNRKPGWYFIAERDPDEPESLQNLRYWYFQSEFAEGITEWDEAAFMAWVASLSDNELSTFADAGEQIALGNWQQHVSDATSDVIDQTRETQQRDDGPVNYVVNAFRGLL
jgi:hypothetical protein